MNDSLSLLSDKESVVFEVPPAIILIGGLTNEGHSGKAIDLDLGTIRAPATLSGGKI